MFNKIRSSLCWVLFISLIGCVTTHPYSYNPATIFDSKVIMSCTDSWQVIHDNFALIICTIENTSNDWLKVSIDKATPLPERTALKILSPNEIKDFTYAYQFKKSQDDYNTIMALAGLMIVGVAVAGVSPVGSTAGTIGGATALGASSTILGKEAIEENRNVQFQTYNYGSQHLLGGEFSIPPKLFIRKKLLIQYTDYCKEFPDKISFCFVSPDKKCFSIDVESGPNPQHCEKQF